MYDFSDLDKYKDGTQVAPAQPNQAGPEPVSNPSTYDFSDLHKYKEQVQETPVESNAYQEAFNKLPIDQQNLIRNVPKQQDIGLGEKLGIAAKSIGRASWETTKDLADIPIEGLKGLGQGIREVPAIAADLMTSVGLGPKEAGEIIRNIDQNRLKLNPNASLPGRLAGAGGKLLVSLGLGGAAGKTKAAEKAIEVGLNAVSKVSKYMPRLGEALKYTTPTTIKGTIEGGVMGATRPLAEGETRAEAIRGDALLMGSANLAFSSAQKATSGLFKMGTEYAEKYLAENPTGFLSQLTGKMAQSEKLRNFENFLSNIVGSRMTKESRKIREGYIAQAKELLPEANPAMIEQSAKLWNRVDDIAAKEYAQLNKTSPQKFFETYQTPEAKKAWIQKFGDKSKVVREQASSLYSEIKLGNIFKDSYDPKIQNINLSTFKSKLDDQMPFIKKTMPKEAEKIQGFRNLLEDAEMNLVQASKPISVSNAMVQIGIFGGGAIGAFATGSGLTGAALGGIYGLSNLATFLTTHPKGKAFAIALAKAKPGTAKFENVRKNMIKALAVTQERATSEE